MRKISFLVALLVCTVQLFTLKAQQTFVVTNTNAGGLNSFSSALSSANSTAGIDIIEFNITGTGPFIIPIGAPMTITEGVIINGFSQPGTVVATSSNKATLMIVLQGTTTPFSNGLVINSAVDVTILGITFNHFDNAIILDNAQLCKIAGCYIGLDYTGLVGDNLMPAMPEVYQNNYGIILRNNTSDCIIGGPIPGDRNVINGNNFSGVDLSSAGPNNKIIGNYIGINADGNTLTDCYNATGVNIVASDYTQVGDDLTSGSNVLSGNYNAGVSIIGANHCTVTGNYIGTDPTGTFARPNVQGNIGGAVHISGGNANMVGGAGIKRNIISGNNAPTSTAYGAVYIHGFGGGTDAWGNVVIGNYIGVAVDGITPLPNIRGVYIDNTAFGNYIGNGVAAGQNIIANNVNEAIVIDGNGTTTNKIALNSVYCNGSGVTLSNFGNALHTTPTIYAVNDQVITGYAAADDSVFIYRSQPNCGFSSASQGKSFAVATKADALGIWTVYPSSIPGLSAGDNLVALGYNSQGMSSKFSADVPMTPCVPFAINAGTDQAVCTNTIVTLSANLNVSTQTGTWYVTNGTANVTDVNDPNSTVTGLTAPGPVNIMWRLKDNTTYCSVYDDVVINVSSCGGGSGPGLIVYNLISPNGDNVYDYLEIENAELYSDVRLTIVNRWGDEVFSISNYNNTSQVFTGHANHGPDKGKLLPDGTYFYRVTYNDGPDLRGYLELKK